jgi:hypothetical protein
MRRLLAAVVAPLLAALGITGISLASAVALAPAAGAASLSEFCTQAANLNRLGDALDKADPNNIPELKTTLGALEPSVVALKTAAPADISADVTNVADAYIAFVDAIQAIDPATPATQQAQQLQTAVTQFTAKANDLQAASDRIDAYVKANCSPSGGVDAGAGGLATRNDDSGGLPTPAVVAGGAVVVAAAAVGGVALRRRRSSIG